MWTLLGTFLGGALVFLANMQKRRWEIGDKANERLAAMDESHRADLRRAYAEFIAAYGHFLDTAIIMVKASAVIEEQKREARDSVIDRGGPDELVDDAYKHGGNPDLKKKVRQYMDDLRAASTAGNARAEDVLMLEDDADRAQLVIELRDANIPLPQSTDDYDRFEHDIQAQRPKLDALTKSLAGAFAPRRLYEKRKALGTGGEKP